MVKSVVGDEAQLKSAEDRLSRSSITAEVGILVGQLSSHSERGFVYHLIPTPPTDRGSPACSLKSESGGRDDRKRRTKGGKASLLPEAIFSLLIDGEWVAEHARQVSRMLLGGMSVIGIYVWCSEASFKATSASLLAQAIRVVAQATPSLESERNERLLIHISYSPKRWTCRSCAVALIDLRPCDFKMNKLLALLQTYRCMYGFDIRIPVFQNLVSTSNTFKNVLCNGISRHAKELLSARALLDGKFVTENQHVTPADTHNVELLLPFKSDVQHESSDDIVGLVVFRGAICAYAYLNPKEPTSQAIWDLKNDIINSLKSRLDILLDEGEDAVDMTSNDLGKESGEIVTGKPIHQRLFHDLRKPLVLTFPRRVLIPWLSDVFICDYLLPSETFEDLKDRCRELLSMETPIESSALLELETEAASPIMTSTFWDLANGNSLSSIEKTKNRSHSISKKSSKQSKNFNFNFQVALFVLLVAFLIGGTITIFNPVKVVH